MLCSQVKIKGADENTHIWRIILNQTFFYFLLEICLPLKPKYQAISLKCFFFYYSLFYHFVYSLPFYSGLPFYICAYKLSVLAQKQWNLFLETSLFKGLTSIQGSQKLVPEKRPHNHCIC